MVRNRGPQIHWVHSQVTDNKIDCICNAANEEINGEHANQGGFPANGVAQVRAIFDPTTAEA